jgi:hypothetical protein
MRARFVAAQEAAMTTRETELRQRSLTSFGTPLVLAIGGIAVIFALTLAYNYGLGLQQQTASIETTAIENEDAAFCSALNITQNSFLYPRCQSGLADIRRSHEQRIAASAIGLF